MVFSWHQGLLGREVRSLPAPWWSWRPGHRCRLSSWESGGPLLPPETGVFPGRGRAARSPAGSSMSQRPHRPLDPGGGRQGAPRRPVDRGSHLMAWARVCTPSCGSWRAVLPTPTGVGGRGRSPLAGPYPCHPVAGALDPGGVPGNPDSGFSCPTNCFTSSDPPLRGGIWGAGLSPDGQLYPGSRATGPHSPQPSCDLEQDARQGSVPFPGPPRQAWSAGSRSQPELQPRADQLHGGQGGGTAGTRDGQCRALGCRRWASLLQGP